MAYTTIKFSRSMSSITTVDPSEYEDGYPLDGESSWEPQLQRISTRGLDHRMIEVELHSSGRTSEQWCPPSSSLTDRICGFPGLERTMTRGPDGKMVVVETFKVLERRDSFGQNLKTKYRRIVSCVGGVLRRAVHFGQRFEIDENDPALISTYQGAYYQRRQRERADSRAWISTYGV